MHPAELSSGLPEIPETFASKAAALAAARKLIREQRAAGREMFGVVSSETKQAINELRAQRAGFSVSPVAAGTWQLMHNLRNGGQYVSEPGDLLEVSRGHCRP